jgi:hypothetical protein
VSPRNARPLAERFWAKVDISGGFFACWPWTAARTAAGYGVLGRGGRSDGLVYAHRLALELAGRPLAPGEDAMHACDNPPCVNPAHLSGGSRATNNRDMASKGRHFTKTKPERIARGERHGMARLTAEQVRAIRTSPASSSEAAIIAGVTAAHVRAIRRGRVWRSGT